MWVTLTTNISSLGPEGATVEVPEGYAVNFLFPQHLAFRSLRQAAPVEEAPQKHRQSADERKDEALAAEVDGVEVVLAGKIKNGVFAKPFSPKELRSELKALGYAVPLEALHISTITEPGTYEVPVVFSTGYDAMITVIAEPLSS